MEQVKAETQQWSHMQEMLGQVRAEMEELQASRDFWEEQALEAEQKIKTLDSDVRLLNNVHLFPNLDLFYAYLLHGK